MLDTKYKAPHEPSSKDLHQIVAYAAAKRAPTAVLIYPIDLPVSYDGRYGGSDIVVRTLRFALDGDLHAEGLRFVDRLVMRSTG